MEPTAREPDHAAGRPSSRALEAIIDALRSPAAYDHPAADIEVIQTHISYVVLAGAFAYKIKKPLSLGFLDYSTLALRKRMCQEEVRLNRRLCDGVYLGVAPITRDGARYRVGGAGEVVEYAVLMRRLEHSRMLDEMIRQGARETASVVHRVGETMARFHREAPTNAELSQYGRLPALEANWVENVRQLEPYAGALFARSELEALDAYGARRRRDDEGLFTERADGGRIRDCHGDLRADSVYVRPDGGVCILDTIEFNDRIRFGDVAGDIGFLAMDLEFRGRNDLADELMATYLSAAPDETLPLVLDYYKTYRAIVRAKVEAMRWSEEEVPMPARADASIAARRYMTLALAYASRVARPVLLFMIGLSGTGKSFLAGAIACRSGAAIVSSDVMRKSVAAGADMYSERERARVYEAMRQRAAGHLSQGRAVILDATHGRRAQRDAARELARRHRVPVVGVEVHAGEDVIRERFAARARMGLSPSDASWDVYVQQRRDFDEIGEDERDVVHISMDSGLDGALPAVLAAVEDLPTPQD